MRPVEITRPENYCVRMWIVGVAIHATREIHAPRAIHAARHYGVNARITTHTTPKGVQ